MLRSRIAIECADYSDIEGNLRYRSGGELHRVIVDI